MRKNIFIVFCAVVFVIIIVGCSKKEKDKPVSIPKMNWGNFVTTWGTDIHANDSVFCARNLHLVGTELIVADTLNNRVLLLDESLNYQSSFGEVGSNAGQMLYPEGANKYSSYYYVADTRNSRILRYNAQDKSFDKVLIDSGTANGKVLNPTDIAFYNDKLFVADAGNSRVQRFNSDGTFEAVINDTTTPLSAPQSLTIDPSNGDLYVTDAPNNRIVRFNSSGAKLGEFGTANLKQPYGVALYRNGIDVRIFVADYENHCVRWYTPTGTLSGTFGSFGTGNGQMRYPTGIAVDSTNNWLFVSDLENCRILKFNLSGTQLASFGGQVLQQGKLNRPRALDLYKVGTTKYLAVCDTHNHRVQIFDTNGNFIRSFGQFGYNDGQFISPMGIAVDSANSRIYVADTGNHRIQVFDLNGNHIATWGHFNSGTGKYEPSAENDGFNRPMGILINSTLNYLYIADCYNHRIKVIDTSNTYIGSWGIYDPGPPAGYYPGSGKGEFMYPSDADKNINGEVLVADSGNRRIQRFNSNGSFIKQYTFSNMLDSPYSLCVGDDGATKEMLYVLDTAQCVIFVLNLTDNKEVGAYGGFGYGNSNFYSPQGIAFDPETGYLYVCDTYNCRIAVVGTR
jgi:DNA-binding beta-propeller fold protein YncE